MKLDLRTALMYAKISDLPAALNNDEFIQCFDLDSGQSQSIEPKAEFFIADIVFSGMAKNDLSSDETVTLPEGIYLFNQYRAALKREEWLAMALEQQKDGLWERYKPENRLYVRYLFEGGLQLTQLFRPVHS
jgi:hypothetical protein